MKRTRTPLVFKLQQFVAALMFSLLAACGGGGNTQAPADTDPRVAELAAQIDAFLQPYLASNGITAATVAVARSGQLVMERGYGFADLAATRTLPADALLSGASIVKPLTAAAIRQLVAAGQVGLGDRVFCAPNHTRGPSNPCWVPGTWVSASDARIAQITVQNLIEHRGGWVRTGTSCWAYQSASTQMQQALSNTGLPCDPLQHDALVRAGLGLQAPPTLEQTVSYFMRGNLDYTPGSLPVSGDRYSNFGYLLLGYIVEQASGQSFNTYVNQQVMAPLGVTAADFKNGASLLADADPREPHYITSMQLPSVFVPNTQVNARDGAIVAGNWVASATSLMTARSMALFAQARRIEVDANGIGGPNMGLPLLGATHNGFHEGDLPGSAAVVRQLNSGLSFAVLMNRNDLYEGTGTRKDYPDEVRRGIDAAIARAGF